MDHGAVAAVRFITVPAQLTQNVVTQRLSIEAITNYIQVSDRIASSGQPEDHQFKSIARAGCKAVINL